MYRTLFLFGACLMAITQGGTAQITSDSTDAARSSSPAAELFAIVRTGDLDRLKQALDNGASAKARDAAGNTPLIQAAV